MKRLILIIAALLVATPAFGQLIPQAILGECYYATTATWLPINNIVNGAGVTSVPPAYALYVLSGSTYYPLACDANGNIGVSTVTAGGVAGLQPIINLHTGTNCNPPTWVTNTGDSNADIKGYCTIPANMLGTTGRIKVRLFVAACTAASTPFAACAGINTGTCKPKVGFSASSAGAGTAQAIPGTLTIAASNQGQGEQYISEASATNVQTLSGYFFNNTTYSSAATVNAAIDTTAASYVVMSIQNSVTTDYCGMMWFVTFEP